MVRLHELNAGELVEVGGEPLGAASGVDEDERAPVLANQLENLGLDVGPDARPRLDIGHALGWHLGDEPKVAHVLDGHDDLDVEVLAAPGVDHGDRPRCGRGAATEEPSDLVERALCCREADALRRVFGDRVESFERE